MIELVEITWQMWLTFAIILAAVTAYASDRFSLELVSGLALGALLLLFHFFPLINDAGENTLAPDVLLSGFASSALLAILGLLIVGQGMYQSGALEYPTRLLIGLQQKYKNLAVLGIFGFVLLVSAFLNNTPVVVMFVPIISAIAISAKIAPSRLMMPLSFMSILGGMMTTIGSSTNLLALEFYRDMTGNRVGFFELAPLGAVLAIFGSVYLAVVARYFLPSRFGDTSNSPDGRQFLAQLTLERKNPLIGERSKMGLFSSLQDVTVRLIQRREEILLPPFDDVTLRLHDKVVVAATRDALTNLLKKRSEILHGLLSEVEIPEQGAGELTMIEAIVAPGSRIIGRSIDQIRFRFQTNCVIVGIQRRSRMMRGDIQSIRLEAGDVLLILGDRGDIHRLRDDRDILMLEQSMTQLPDAAKAPWAIAIFVGIVGLVSTNILPIVVAALLGATLMVASGCLNVRQASRAVDRRVYLLIGAAIAMGLAMERTGGATYLSSLLTPLAEREGGATLLLSVFFLMTAILTNLLSNNATAVLMTPIAIASAASAGIDPIVLVFTVIYAANCSFATPVAYQTNLIVMAPGHYQFRDFVIVGMPLIILLWLVYTVAGPMYFHALGLL